MKPTLQFQDDYPDYVCGSDAAPDFHYEDYAETLLTCSCGCPYTKAEAQRILKEKEEEVTKAQEPKVCKEMVFPQVIAGIMVPFFPKTDEDVVQLSKLIGDQCLGTQFKTILSYLAFLAVTNGISEYPSSFFDSGDEFLLSNPLLASNVQPTTRQPSPPPEELKVRQNKSIFFNLTYLTYLIPIEHTKKKRRPSCPYIDDEAEEDNAFDEEEEKSDADEDNDDSEEEDTAGQQKKNKRTKK